MAIQPPQRFELDDLAHVEREARTIYAPGATPGDVLVVQSDHSLVAAPGGGAQPAVAWANVKTIGFADTPADGTVIDMATLAAETWLSDVYVSLRDGWQAPNGARFSACGWDLAGNAGGPYYLHGQMTFNPVSWAELHGTQAETLPSLASCGLFLGSTDPSASPPVTLETLLPTLVGSVTPDDSLPLQILFADAGPVSYSAGQADIWLLKQDPA